MNEMTYNELVEQVRQHEEIITQLLEIVAASNRRLSELEKQKTEWYMLT